MIQEVMCRDFNYKFVQVASYTRGSKVINYRGNYLMLIIVNSEYVCLPLICSIIIIYNV